MTDALAPVPPTGVTRTLIAASIGVFAFVTVLCLAALAVRHGLIDDEAVRLWAGASAAADGEMPIGRIVAAYPTLPFMITALATWLSPHGAPAPALIAAAVLALIAACCFAACRRAGFSVVAAAAVTLLIAFHPAFLRAAIVGPGEMFLCAFLLMFCFALYDLRARSGTAEVMNVGLTLMGLAFSDPMGAAFAFGSVPFLGLAVRPVLVANAALNVLVALVFPTVFAIAAFSYVAWIFPGDGWTFFNAPTEALSLWSAAAARLFGDTIAGFAGLEAAAVMAVALVLGAPLALVVLIVVRRRRPLVIPALVFAASAIAATAISVWSGYFGDPVAIVVAAPVLAAGVALRVPLARERSGLAVALLAVGWLGGIASLLLVDPLTINRLQGAVTVSGRERLAALAAGGAAAGRAGMLVDIDNAPAFVVGRGSTRGILAPHSEQFALALMFSRIDSPFVAVPDPQSRAGASDRLDIAFPSLFRDGLPGYRIIYQNNIWRLYGRLAVETNITK